MPNKLFSLIALFFLVFCSQIVSVFPQETTAIISGVVTDETGGLIPGVSIEVTNLDTGITRMTTTGDEGRYQVPTLSVGNYQVEASLTGFQTGVRTGITLTVGRAALVDFALSVGEISERVTVTGEAPLVETTRSVLTDLVSQQQIADLPLNGRSYTQLALLQPGVTTLGSQNFSSISGGGAKLSMAGARSTNTYFYLDGTEVKDSFGHTPGSAAGQTLGVDTIREFSVVVSSFSAEFGGSGGVISSVTKSGTNQIHGSVFEYHRNSALDARNFFDTDPRDPLTRSAPPPFIRNQFGFTLGGPIIQDKTFFFGSYEGLRERLSNTRIINTPTDAVRNGMCTSAPLPPGCLASGPVTTHPEVQPYVDVMPSPNGRDNGNGSGEFISTQSRPIDEDYFMVKVDHQLSDSDSVFGRYTLDNASRVQPQAYSDFFTEAETRSQYVTLEWNRIISPTLLNTFRAGLNRSKGGDINRSSLDESFNIIDAPDRIPPNLTVGTITTWGPSNAADRFSIVNVFQFTDRLTYTKGRHSIRAGVDIWRYQLNGSNRPRVHGRVRYGGYADFLEGRPRLLEFLVPGSGDMRGFRQTVPGFYFQDDFQLFPNLTINMGLRFEFVTIPVEVAGRISNLRDVYGDSTTTVGDPFFKLPKNNFGPRIGFAWDPFNTGKTSLRGGFGIFHMQMTYVNWRFPALQNPPFTIRTQQVFPVDANGRPEVNWKPVIDLDGPFPPANLAAQMFDIKTPYMMQYNLTLQRELWSDMMFALSYVGSHGVHLGRLQPANIAEFTVCPCPQDPSVPDGTKFWEPNADRLNPAFGSIDMRQFDTNSTYNSLQLRVTKRFTSGLQFQTSYTWSNAIDESIGQEGFSGGGWDSYSMDPFDRSRDKGPSSWDLRHNFVANFTYDLPFGANQTGAAGKILGGWQTSGILNMNTGNPSFVSIRFNNSRNLQIPSFNASERPDLIPGTDNNPVLGGPDQYLDPSSFVVATPGTMGNLGRNTITQPGLVTLDFSLVKNTYVSEQVNFQFRAEFFNIFNRANFAAPSTNVFSSSRNPTRVSGSFGRITRTRTTSRQIQFALKILF
ncbi:MAG: carboxypeptidase regulatory-like domain-containing protein [Acidobacteria bacterium]|nr:carboxypeptidase regulatory-like domain-containing protein [Acidobacteriota bacterium]